MHHRCGCRSWHTVTQVQRHGGFMVTLQIYVHGIVQVTGIALLSSAMAAYALVTLIKYMRV
jgi:hypothetical protein